MLHIVNKSPFSRTALADCLRVIVDTGAIMLIEDGTYAALADSAWAQRLQNCGRAIYALREDCDARGLTARIAAHVRLVDYAGFVQLCCEHTGTQSWY